MEEVTSFKCVACGSTMTAEGKVKHLYACSKTTCGARAVITPKGTTDSDGKPEVFRYNLPPVGEWPTTGDTPRPKGAASFARRSGEGETIASMPGGLMRVLAETVMGNSSSAVDIVNEMLPPGVSVTTDPDGNVKVEGLHEQPEEDAESSQRPDQNDRVASTSRS